MYHSRGDEMLFYICVIKIKSALFESIIFKVKKVQSITILQNQNHFTNSIVKQKCSFMCLNLLKQNLWTIWSARTYVRM